MVRKVYTPEEKIIFAAKMKAAREARKLNPVYGPKKAPKYGPKNKPKPRVPRAQYVSRVSPLSLFDAISNKKHSLPLYGSLSDSITQDYVHRVTQTPSTTTPIFYIYMFTNSEVYGVRYTQSVSADAALTPFSFSQMVVDTPHTMRPSRMTISLLNTASTNVVSGTVTIGVVKNSLDWSFSSSTTAVEVTVAFMNSMQAVLENGDSTLVATGKSCQDGHQFSLVPISIVNLSKWSSPVVVGGSVPLLKAALEGTQDDASHSCLIIRFDPVASQSYNLACNSQYSMRYPANSVLGSLNQKQPTMKAEILQSHVDKAFDKSPVGRHQVLYM